MLELKKIYNMDCMDGLRQMPDKCIDLAICDPPYYSGPEKRAYYGKKVSSTGVKRLYRPVSKWDIPREEYFEELIRVSKDQIIFGCNYFDYYLGSGRIVWDKCNGSSTFSDCEIAYCSMHDSTRLFRFMWNGMMQGKSINEGHIAQGNKALNEKRIHPTQKPVALYCWILKTYAKDGFKIMDTHMGSGSSIIACIDMGFDYIAFEKDKYYFNAAISRIDQHLAQIRFDDLLGGT